MEDMGTQMRIWWLKGMWSLKEISDYSIRSEVLKGGGGFESSKEDVESKWIRTF